MLQIWFLDYFSMSISSASSHMPHKTPLQDTSIHLDREGIKEREDGKKGGAGDYLREAIVLNISI